MSVAQPIDLTKVFPLFEIPGRLVSSEPYGHGHINDTLRVTASDGGGERRWIFQRVNTGIFRDIDGLMDNIVRVTAHVARRGAALPAELRQRSLSVVPARDGRPYARDPEGRCWRVYDYLEATETIEAVDRPARAFETARSFAVFQGLLSDLPAPRLRETIPHFHDTPQRYADFEAALAADACNRAAGMRAEIADAQARAAIVAQLTTRLASGVLPERVTHNDTKINNIRFDCASGRGAAIIDLDTVMPGLVHYDFGDMVRTAAFEGAEDDPKLEHVVLRPDFFRELVRGFLEGGRAFLTPAEVDWLVFAGRLICFEIGLRFLTDHLKGDVYFKTHRPGHNLDRARVQLRRVREVERATRELDAAVAACR